MTSPAGQGVKNKAYKLARQGRTRNEIADKVGYNPRTVSTWLKEAGIEPGIDTKFLDEQWLEENCDIYFGCSSPESISRFHGGRPSKDYLRRRRKALYPEIKFSRKAPRLKGERWAALKSVEAVWDDHYHTQQLIQGWKR